MPRVHCRAPSTGLAAGAGALVLVLTAALPAWASSDGSTIDSPDSGAVVTAADPLPIRATVGPDDPAGGDPVVLTVTDPRGPSDSQQQCRSRALGKATAAGPLNVTIDPYDAYPDSCGGAAGLPALNGTWTLALSGSGATATRTFTFKVPPKAPAHLAVAANGSTLHATWTANPELDVDAYAVAVDGAQGTEHPAADVCKDGACTLDLPGSSAGSHTVTVGALRWTSYSDHTHLPPVTSSDSASVAAASSPSAPTSAPTSAAASARPSAKATSSPLPAFHYSPNPLSTKDEKKFAATFNNFKDLLTSSPLPGLHDSAGPSASPDAGDGEPTDFGTYKSTLGYKDSTRDSASSSVEEEKGVPLAGVADAIGVQPSVLWRSMAGGALLVLAFGHLRLWLGRRVSDWD